MARFLVIKLEAADTIPFDTRADVIISSNHSGRGTFLRSPKLKTQIVRPIILILEKDPKIEAIFFRV